MATVTGMTAAKMQEIADDVVVDGDVDGFGHLILTKHDGSSIDAGNVVGEPGPSAPDASTTVKGKLKLADHTLVLAGTDDLTAVTPLGAKLLIDDRVHIGTVDISWTTGQPNVTLEDGVTIVSAKFNASDADIVPGATVKIFKTSAGVWIIDSVLSSLVKFPKWVDLVLQNGWTYLTTLPAAWAVSVVQAVWHKPQVTKTTANYVEVAGTITGGLTTAGTVIATLPLGFRPLVNQKFIVGYSTGNASIAVEVQTNGNIVLVNSPTNVMLSLDGIGYTVDPALVWTSLASIGYANAYTDVGGVEPIGEVTVDSVNRVIVHGRVKRISGATVGVISNAMPSAMQPGASAPSIFLQLNDVALFRMDLATTGALSDPVGVNPTNLDLSSIWLSQNFSGQWYVPKYTGTNADYGSGFVGRAVAKTSDQMVLFRGLISATANGGITEVLPTGWRPIGIRRFLINSNNTIGTMYVFPDGTSYLGTGATFESLVNLRFVAEQ